MKIILIGGEPATGKSTIVKKIKGKTKFFKITRFTNNVNKTIIFEVNDNKKLIILGHYLGDLNDGTDKMDLGIQPAVEDWIIKVLLKKRNDYTLLLEGDRLFNEKFINYILDNKIDLTIILLKINDDESIKRHIVRGDKQGDTFLKGRKTKYNNLENIFKCMIYMNNNLSDQIKIINTINELIK